MPRLITAVLVGLCLLVAKPTYAADKPNLIYIMVDDLGEMTDVAAENPGVVEKVKKAFGQSHTDAEHFPFAYGQ